VTSSSIDVFEDAVKINSMCMIKSWSKTRKKENMEIKNYFYVNIHLK